MKTLAQFTREDWFALYTEGKPEDFKRLGFAIWNELNDSESGIPLGKVLYLIPHAVYGLVPEGFPIMSISGELSWFCRKVGKYTQDGETDDDHRGGMLAFGIPVNLCPVCGGLRMDWQVYCGAACAAQAGA